MTFSRIAIDPGKNGGAAALTADGDLELFTYSDELPGILASRSLSTSTVVTIEKAQASPQMGVVSAFNYGRGAGVWHGVFLGLGISPTYLRPVEWQKPLGIAKGMSYQDRKRWLRDRARELFPATGGITLATCDSLLILDYALGGELELFLTETR